MKCDLVFEGGGAKGVAFAGALRALEERGFEPRRLVGTSAGAITATTLAAGYSAVEMDATAREKNDEGEPVLSTFMDIPRREAFTDEVAEASLTYELFRAVDLPLVPGWAEGEVDRRVFRALLNLAAYRELFSFVELGGLYEGKMFLDWIVAKIEAKRPGLGSATLEDFSAATQVDLSLVVSDTTARELRVLNHRTAPHCPVAWAVRMSMSIPFLWQEVTWRPDWGAYLGKSLVGHKMIDGGALSNFALDLLVSEDAQVTAVMGEPPAAPDRVLGFLIDEDRPVPGAPEPPDPAGDGRPGADMLGSVRRLRTIERIRRLVDTITKAHDHGVIEANPDKVVRLPAAGYGTTEFDMTDERMTALIEAAAAATRDFFA